MINRLSVKAKIIFSQIDFESLFGLLTVKIRGKTDGSIYFDRYKKLKRILMIIFQKYRSKDNYNKRVP